MGLLDSLSFEPDAELRAFLEEYDATNGRMYQDQNRPEVHPNESGLPPMRPEYYGRKPLNKLRPMRTLRLMTQAELTAKSGTARRTIIAIENSRREPSVYLAIAIAQALDMKVEDIFHLPYLTPVPPSKH